MYKKQERRINMLRKQYNENEKQFRRQKHHKNDGILCFMIFIYEQKHNLLLFSLF